MKIVRMEEAHIKALAELERVCFHAPWSEQALREELYNDANLFLVALDQDIVCGYVGCQTVLDEGYITNVAVHQKNRRCGVATRLLQKLTDYANERNLAFLTLEVRESNVAAIQLYRAQGYVEVGCRKGFYRNPEENAILMTKYFSKAQV